MIINYQPFSASGTKSGKCPGCHKPAARSTTITQTLNPFNKKDGRVKTVSEIEDENRQKLLEWKEKPVWHVKCESAAKR